jgi:CO/xanthine dehydrogenase FAD-binding subunit
MITAYHRPQTLDEALTLLTQPNTVPLGGGTLLSHASFQLSAGLATDSIEAVDLQLLGLNSLNRKGNELEIGATLTLQAFLESEHCPEAMKSALRLEAPLNIRNSATVAGALVTCDGRSTLATALLAMDAKLDYRPLTTGHSHSSVVNGLGDFLPLRPRGLITSITIPTNVKLAFEYVSRTPADKPIVCVALAQWNSGRTRLAVGGFGKSPMLGMDGTESEGVDTSINSVQAAARNAFYEATDEWASAGYRMDVAATLATRCLNQLRA